MFHFSDKTFMVNVSNAFDRSINMAIGFFHQVVSIFDLPIHLVLIRLNILL